VFRVSPDLGTLTLLVSDFVLPNGLAFSPDESVLYINDSRRGHIRAFDVQDDGTLSLASDQVFCELRGDRPGVPDGMKVDVEGNVYCGGSGGLWIIDSSGKHLGTIVHGAPATTNLAFGGEDWRTLFFTTRTSVGRVQCKIPGVSVPVAR
jgi:gluconolactonase